MADQELKYLDRVQANNQNINSVGLNCILVSRKVCHSAQVEDYTTLEIHYFVYHKEPEKYSRQSSERSRWLKHTLVTTHWDLH